MTKTRTYPTLHVASALTGVALCEGMTYATMHEITAFLAGHEVWTHELGNKPLMLVISDHAREYLQDMPTYDEARHDYQAAAAKAIAAYGETVEVRKGALTREAGPVETMMETLAERGQP